MINKSKAKNKKKKLNFIDLFAGIGGFHQAAIKNNLNCVFTSEIDGDCAKVYNENFRVDVSGDITKIPVDQIPKHDFLFAGFPCQPFSKGGFRKGFADSRGNLFFAIAEILKHHKPTFFILENVQNLVSHDRGNTYRTIIEILTGLGYSVPQNPIILSPNQFGVPVLRKRIYIPGILKERGNFDSIFETLLSKKAPVTDAYSIIEEKYNNDVTLKISEYESKIIKMWDEFYKGIDIKIIGFPVWAEYFFGNEIKLQDIPDWKATFIKKNLELYMRNKDFIDQWKKRYDNLNWVKKTHKKFEWQCGTRIGSLYSGLIQFRPSGVRVKTSNYFSTLVAMNHNQIIGKYKRRLSPEEVKKLQSFNKDFILHKDSGIALRQLGNAVNVDVVNEVLKIMVNFV